MSTEGESKASARPSLAGAIPERFDFPGTERKVLELWEHLDAFKTQLRLSEGKPEYTFYDGPPFATGLPHYGHILAGTIKDVVTRYHSMDGHYVSRRFGWDCHGLPVEYEIDKKLKITSTDDVEKMGIRAYNKECRGIVSRYCEQWEEIVTRLGRWIDFRNDYKTMEPWYMESVWWVFKTIFNKDLVYRGFKIMPYSTACNTPLSNFEAGQNYKDDTRDPAVVASFPIVGDEGTAFVAWTTTPWTLPSNLALCVNPAMTYVKVHDKKRDTNFILMESCLSILYPKVNKDSYVAGSEFDVLEKYVGSDLVGKTYVPLFDYFADHPNAFRVVADDYVTDDAGTGVVHNAPAFGEDDYRVCMANGVIVKAGALPCPVDANGRFTAVVTDFAKRYVKEADNDICALLKKRGRLVQKGTVVHRYPFCWRSDTPLIYKAVPSWFVNVTAIKDKLLANNAKTYWVPAFVKEKRFHNWLSDARDWAVSRTRYWGTPIPLWVSDDGEEVVCIGSIAELEELSGETVTDLHRENIDHITIPSRMGKGVLHRVPEVFDCWFESGSMPYAQVHYPFENKEKFEASQFPANFIAEGLDQTRGWFYTLMVLSTALFDKPAFKNLIVNGLVLAEDGKKMSKRLKNYPDPKLVIELYGADALRLYLVNSPVVRAEPLCFRQEGVLGVIKDVFLPWYNAFRFFIMNARRAELDTGVAFVPNSELVYSSTNPMDQWLMAALQKLIKSVRTEMEAYKLYNVAPALVAFVDQLTNWYVRLNRSRLKGQSGEEDAARALNGLYEVLLVMVRLMAPLTPFLTEYMYQHLRTFHPASTDPSAAEDAVGRAESVHFLAMPNFDESKVNDALVLRVQAMQSIIELGRQVRDKESLSTKNPVREVLVVHADAELLSGMEGLSDYIKSELNALNLTLTSDEATWCDVAAEANPRTLGKRLGKQLGSVKKAVAALSRQEVSAFARAGEDATLEVEGVTLGVADVNVVRAFKGDPSIYSANTSKDGDLTVAVNVVQDAELRAMHLGREAVNRVQKLRKAAGLAFTDAVTVYFDVAVHVPEKEVPGPELAPEGVNVDVSPEDFVRRPKEPEVGAGAGSGAGAGDASAKKQKANKWSKGKKKKKPQGDGAGKKKQAQGGKKQKQQGGGKKKAAKKKGGKKPAAAAPVRATLPELTGEEAVSCVRNAISSQAEAIAALLGNSFAPAVSQPEHAVVLAKETSEVGGAALTVTLTRPHLLFSTALPEECKGSEELFTTLLANRDLDRLQGSLTADGGVTLTVRESTATLFNGRHFFTSPADLVRSDAGTRAKWTAAGYEGMFA